MWYNVPYNMNYTTMTIKIHFCHSKLDLESIGTPDFWPLSSILSPSTLNVERSMFQSLLTCPRYSTLVESPRHFKLFLQNEPNLNICCFTPTSFYIEVYANSPAPNVKKTNPIQTQTKPFQIQFQIRKPAYPKSGIQNLHGISVRVEAIFHFYSVTVSANTRFSSCIKMRDFVDCGFDNPFITGGNRHES